MLYLPRIFSVLLLTLLFTFCFGRNVHAQKRIVGYYPAWLQSVLPAQKVQFENLTHINHSFAWPTTNGELEMYDDLIYPELNQLAHQANVKMLISLGGWGNSEGFSPSVATAEMRAKFIESIVLFISTHNYDGVDIDWEFPETATDRQNLTVFIREMHTRFSDLQKDWIITFAVGSGDWSGQWFDFTELQPYVDAFNAMCYDFSGNWSTQVGHNAALFPSETHSQGSIKTTMHYLHNTRGIDKSKLVVGVPFYGKMFPAPALGVAFSGDVMDMRYYEIFSLINNGWQYHWDETARVPFLTDDEYTRLITFEDVHSIEEKCEWIQQQDYAGAMIWALGQDKSADEQPLLQEMAKHLLTAETGIDDFKVESKLTAGSGSFPNPFNPNTTIHFSIPAQCNVNVAIFDCRGKCIRTLANGIRSAGTHYIVWDGFNDSHTIVSSGIYFYRIIAQNTIQTGKMLFAK